MSIPSRFEIYLYNALLGPIVILGGISLLIWCLSWVIGAPIVMAIDIAEKTSLGIIPALGLTVAPFLFIIVLLIAMMKYSEELLSLELVNRIYNSLNTDKMLYLTMAEIILFGIVMVVYDAIRRGVPLL